jgi:PAS domain S-box-containing protein
MGQLSTSEKISRLPRNGAQDRGDKLPSTGQQSIGVGEPDRNEQLLRALIEHCPQCVKLLRPDGTLVQMNPAGLWMVEADSLEQVIGKSVFDLIAPEDRHRFRVMHERVCNGDTARLEYELIGLKGRRRKMETHAAPVPDPDQPGFLHLAITRDISEREEGTLTSRRLSAIIESSDDAIISKDLNGIITTWNQGAERIFGYSAEEAIGKPVQMLIPEDRPNEEPDILGRIRRGERIDHYDTIRRRKDGTLVNISLSISPIKDSEGHVVGASKIARDITARKRAHDELRAAKEELARMNDELEQRVCQRTASLTEAISQMEEFSYTLSHDLRAPARAMTGYSRIILDDFSQNLDAQAKDFLERIIRGGERMDRLIQDVLTYSKLSRREMELRKVDLDKLVADIVQQYPDMQRPRAEITIRGPLLPVLAHEPSLAQAISNLLGNAVKFVPAGEPPRIVVRTEARGPKVRLWVEDNGIGIKPEHQARIFGIFERLPTVGRYEGTGIGLAIVRKAAEKMGGSSGVESDGLTGSRFWIELPAAQNT